MSEIVMLRNALRVARAEIEWWVDEHACCAGHEGPALDVIEEAMLLSGDNE